MMVTREGELKLVVNCDIERKMVEAETKKIQLFDRLMDFPVIASICVYVQLKYEEAKKSEKFGEFVVKAEKIVFESVEKLQPIIKNMENNISIVDDLAIKGLNKVEEYFPITKKQPGEIKEALMAYAKELKESGHLSELIKTLLSLVVEGTKLLLQMVIGFVKSEFAIETLVRIIDYLLPPLKDEETSASSSLMERFKDYSSKVYNRVTYYKGNFMAKTSELKWDDLPLVALPAKLFSVVLALYYRIGMDFLAVVSTLLCQGCKSSNQ